MLKPNHLGYLAVGLMLLLTACGGAVTAPAELPAPQAVDVEEIAPEEVGPEENVVAEDKTMPQDKTSNTPAEEAAAEKNGLAEEVVSAEEEIAAAEISLTEQGPTAEQLQLLESLSSRGTPPELFNEVWLNSEPLKLADLHGKVVIVEFWTFG